MQQSNAVIGICLGKTDTSSVDVGSRTRFGEVTVIVRRGECLPVAALLLALQRTERFPMPCCGGLISQTGRSRRETVMSRRVVRPEHERALERRAGLGVAVELQGSLTDERERRQ